MCVYDRVRAPLSFFVFSIVELVRKNQRVVPQILMYVIGTVNLGVFVVLSLFVRNHQYIQIIISVLSALAAAVNW